MKQDHFSSMLIKRAIFEDPLELFFSNQLQRNLFEEVLQNNAVITGNKLAIYYYLRKAQKDWPQLMDHFIDGLDYYVSKPKERSCYYLGTMPMIFEEEELKGLNTM